MLRCEWPTVNDRAAHNAPEGELTRLVKARSLPADPVRIEANAAERTALAQRFGLTSIEKCHACITLSPDKLGSGELDPDALGTGEKAVRAQGTLHADFTQPCAISAQDFAVRIEERIDLRFVAAPAAARQKAEKQEAEKDVEIELSSDDLDEIAYSGSHFDLGEAVAQSLGLAIDPYAEGPEAQAVREKAGIISDETPQGPLAEALTGWKPG